MKIQGDRYVINFFPMFAIQNENDNFKIISDDTNTVQEWCKERKMEYVKYWKNKLQIKVT